MFCGIKRYNMCSNAVFQHRHSTAPQLFSNLFIPQVDDALFEVDPEIRYSGVSSRYNCYGNYAAGSKPI